MPLWRSKKQRRIAAGEGVASHETGEEGVSRILRRSQKADTSIRDKRAPRRRARRPANARPSTDVLYSGVKHAFETPVVSALRSDQSAARERPATSRGASTPRRSDGATRSRRTSVHSPRPGWHRQLYSIPQAVCGLPPAAALPGSSKKVRPGFGVLRTVANCTGDRYNARPGERSRGTSPRARKTPTRLPRWSVNTLHGPIDVGSRPAGRHLGGPHL
jgi:hypothetical protein